MSGSVCNVSSPERLSEALQRLLALAEGRSLAVGRMVEILQGRGLQVVIILLCLPFLAPVTIPGISIPFGFAIALSGVRLAFGHKPWLPRFIMERQVSYQMLERMVRFGCRIYGRIERVVKPRYTVLLDAPGMNVAIGLAIATAGIFLSLPIPPPFPLTNTIPGFAIIFLSLGIMERDGILIVVGYSLTVLAALYLVLIAFAGQAGAMQLWKLFTGS